MFRKSFYFILLVLLSLCLFAAGCGGTNKKASTGVSDKVREELVPFMKEHKIPGELTAHTAADNPDGYVALVHLQNSKGVVDSAIIVDKKNNRKASVIIYNDKIFNPIINPDAVTPAVFPVKIYNDTKDQDKDAGIWKGSDHILPIYAVYTYNPAKGAIPGSLNTGFGENPSQYREFLYEQKNVDLLNLFIKSLPEVYEKLMGTTIEEARLKAKQNPAGNQQPPQQPQPREKSFIDSFLNRFKSAEFKYSAEQLISICFGSPVQEPEQAAPLIKAANEKYTGKKMEIIGVVQGTGVFADINQAYVVLYYQESQPRITMIATLKNANDANKLKVGNIVKLNCFYEGAIDESKLTWFLKNKIYSPWKYTCRLSDAEIVE